MSNFVIETNVEMAGHRNRYSFDTMQPKESFAIVGDEDARKVRNAAYQYAKKVNTKAGLKKGQPGAIEFALRKVAEHAVEGSEAKIVEYRLWRVA